MPSPFPGMDPYLEEPYAWGNFHYGLIAAIQVALAAQLRPRYAVRVEERVYVTHEDDPGRDAFVPDLYLVSPSQRNKIAVSNYPPVDTNAALVAEPISVTTLIDNEIHEALLEIRDPQSREVVTVIEVLSPANKIPYAAGRDSYVQKRRILLRSSANLVELDLLRAGLRASYPSGVPASDYVVSVSRAESVRKCQIWPILLTQSLPVIPIPLRQGEAEISLNLQQLFSELYDRAGYDLNVDYTQDPKPPLPEKYVSWAAEIRKKTVA